MPGTVEISIVSASFSPRAAFDSEPSDAYAILRCSKHQYRTKTAKDQGRLPVWNETFTLDLKEEEEEEALSKELVVQVFSARNEADDLLGIAKIPLFSMVGKDEATLSALINPRMGETGKLKVAWKWNSVLQKPLKATTNEGKVSEVYEYRVSDSDKLDALSNVMMQLNVEEKTSVQYTDSTNNFTASAPPYIEDGNVKNFSYPSFSSADYTSSYQPTSALMNEKTYLGYQSSTSDYTSHGSYPSYPTAQVDIIPSYPLSKESYPPDKTNNMHAQLHTNNDMGYQRYPPPPDERYQYPPLYPQEGGHQPLDIGYPPSYPSALEKGSSHMGEAVTPLSNERVFDTDKGKDKDKDKKHKDHKDKDKEKKHKDKGKDKEKKHKDKGKDKEKKHKEKKDKKEKEKHKSHDSHVTYSQLPLHGYHPQYPPPPPYGHPPEAAHGYSPGPYGYSPAFQSYHAPQGYPQEYSLTPQGYSPSPHGYPPPFPHGYPTPSPHGYPPPFPHGYPTPSPHGYPPASPHGYPQEYPSHPRPHYPVEYGYPSQTQPNYPIEHGSPGSGHGKQH